MKIIPKLGKRIDFITNQYEQKIMKQISIIFLSALLLSSCASFRNAPDNSNRIMLTESNLTLLNGRYERQSVQRTEYPFPLADLFLYFFIDLYSFQLGRYGEFRNKRAGDFVELEVIDSNRILASLMNGEEVLAYRIFRGRINRGYFEFRRRHFFFSILVASEYTNSRFRIALSDENNLITDYRRRGFDTYFILFASAGMTNSNVEFRRIENVIEYSNESNK